MPYEDHYHSFKRHTETLKTKKKHELTHLLKKVFFQSSGLDPFQGPQTLQTGLQVHVQFHNFATFNSNKLLEKLLKYGFIGHF